MPLPAIVGVVMLWIAAIYIIAAVLTLIYWYFKPSKPKPRPLPQDPEIQVFFNYNQSVTYQEPYRHIPPRYGDNLEQIIVDTINKATTTVEVAVMELRLPNIANALVQAQSRGVKVRVVIDNKYNNTVTELVEKAKSRGMSSHDSSAYKELRMYPSDAITILRNANIPLKDDTSSRRIGGSGIMHHKWVIVDAKIVLISSANFTTSDIHGDFGDIRTRGNPNNMVLIPNAPDLAAIFQEEFELLWKGLSKIDKPWRGPKTVSIGGGTVSVQFSPVNRRKIDISSAPVGLIIHYLIQSQQSIHIAVFAFSEQHISDYISLMNNRGVADIKILIDKDYFSGTYSKAYDAMGVCPNPEKKIFNPKSPKPRRKKGEAPKPLPSRSPAPAPTKDIDPEGNIFEHVDRNPDKPDKREEKAGPLFLTKRKPFVVHPWSKPIQTVGFPTGVPGDRSVHSKIGIIDSSLVLTGSFNWSNAGNYSNDETLIAIDNPLVAAHYEREFDRLYSKAALGLQTLPDAVNCSTVPPPKSPTPKPRKRKNLDELTDKDLQEPKPRKPRAPRTLENLTDSDLRPRKPRRRRTLKNLTDDDLL